jgi:4-amino-4-deoxy-L-arabinose transferase-like glycosyltransferase
MFKAPAPKHPADLSYFALRKAVGGVALALPFATAIPWALLHHAIQTSISAYYYTGMRNLFVGFLCAIGMFMLCTRGYDRVDEVAGIFSGICAIGVAFFPTSPANGATHRQLVVGDVHYIFAAALFLMLAFFCLVLFRMSAHKHTVTPRKIQRNRVYTTCGIVILISLALLPAMTFVFHVKYVLPCVAPGIFFETTSLLAFGTAWLVKGETILKDQTSQNYDSH